MNTTPENNALGSTDRAEPTIKFNDLTPRAAAGSAHQTSPEMSVTLQVTVDEDDDERFIFVFKEQFRLFRSLAGTSHSARTAEKFENLMNQAHAIVLAGKLKEGREALIQHLEEQESTCTLNLSRAFHGHEHANE